MLKLVVYGSSSKGNCYVLSNNDTSIMLDCGIKNLQKHIDLKTINGVILTHLHTDHTKGVKDIKDYYMGKFYGNKETLDILPIIQEYKECIQDMQKIEIGTFTIVCFSLEHDVPCLGYLIKDNLSGCKLLYCTDTGQIDYSFNDIDFFLIESNCDEDTLDYSDYKQKRLYNTHLSMQQCWNFVENNVNINTKNVILCHISSGEENYLKHEEYIKSKLNDENINVVAIDPHLKHPLEIVLKHDIDINFD